MAMLKYAAAAASIGTGLAAGGYRYKKEVSCFLPDFLNIKIFFSY